ncbi:hypothetical protein FB446DRAFT_834202 [Lentinula raphanica]|nr:hypothetical protein FB446DRAFT_834202 [Lentinula raphanica]
MSPILKHVPGKLNIVADGLRQWDEGSSGFEGNGKVVSAIGGLRSESSMRVKARAQHRVKGYMVEDGKLWKVGGNGGARARPRVECITKAEAVEMAGTQHKEGGHWGRDAVKIVLLDKICSPKLDKSVTKGSLREPRVSEFFEASKNSLGAFWCFLVLSGAFRCFQWEKAGIIQWGCIWMCVRSMHGGSVVQVQNSGNGKNHGLIIATYFPRVHSGRNLYVRSGSPFPEQGGCRVLRERMGEKQQLTPAYSPWVNGLVEGANRLLLHVLKRLCAPDVGEDWDERKQMDSFEKLPNTWPERFDEAIRILNQRVLPALKFSPKELLLGLAVNTPRTSLEVSTFRSHGSA